MPRTLYDAELFADYFQIYLRDEAHPELPDEVTEATLACRLALAPYGMVLHTARNTTVPVRVEWHAQRPDPVLEDFHYVVEAGFDSPSGKLVLAGITDYEPEAARLDVPPGPIAVRVSMSGLDTISDDGLDGGDHYRIQLWPRTGSADVQILKGWDWD